MADTVWDDAWGDSWGDSWGEVGEEVESGNDPAITPGTISRISPPIAYSPDESQY